VDDLRIVVRYRREPTTGHHAVLGALATEPPPGRWSVEFATDADQAVAALERGLRDAHRVLVTWSFYSPDAQLIADELATLRDRIDDVRITHLAGGPHASAEPEWTLRAGFDLVCAGEGEIAIVELCRALVSGGPVPAVPGLAALDDAGALVRSPAAPRHDLDRFPSFASAWGRFGPIEITRGCIYSCRFCQTPYLFKARFRHRSVADVRAHVEELAAHGLRYVRFLSPTALSYGTQDETPDLDAVDELLGTARAAIGAHGKVYFGSFPSELRPEHVTPEAMAVLSRHVDNTAVIIGAQSGDEGVLEAIRRGHGTAEVERAVRVALAAGFRPDVDFLFGLPEETPDAARRSVAFAGRLADLGARIHAHSFLPLPGTPLRNVAPDPLADDVRLDLDRLTARGRLYGQWRRQEQLAAQLVPLVRRPRQPRRPDPG